MATKTLDLSFVIPAHNEESSIEILYKELTDELKRIKETYEIVFVDDGSKDSTYKKLKGIHKKDKKVKVVRLRGNWGKATALQAGFELVQGDTIITLDADLQDNPKEIKNFLKKINEGYDLVVGWKKIRHDPMSKLISTKLFNFAVRKLTGLTIHDVNCGFKAYKKQVIDNIQFYGDLFRLIPVMAHKQNFKVTEIEVEHRPRKFGKTKYGLERSYKGALDLLTVIFLTGYRNRPGHFFGSLGLISFSMGFIIGLYITYLRVTTGSIQFRHPLLFLGMLLMIIGVQLVSTGLIAEMFINFHQKRESPKQYIQDILD